MSAPTNLPNPDLINKTRQDLSAGLLEASFGILGQTFAQDANNPNLAAPYEKLGATIAGALHDRWNKQEYENFQAQYVSKYQQAANAISGNLQMQMASLDRGELIQPDGSITKIDPKSEGFLRTKDTIIRQTSTAVQKINDQFLQDAAKFATNPYISNVAQNLMSSQANMIAQATGPTPADEAEKGLSDIEQNRAQTGLMKAETGYYNRMPADRGGSEKETKRGDPVALMQELGPDAFTKMLVGSEMGVKLTQPFQTTAAAQIKRELLDSDPNLVDDPDTLNIRMGEKEQAIQERAAGLYMKTVFPDIAGEMKGLDEFSRFFPEPIQKAEAQPITGLLTKEETKAYTDNINENALKELEQVIRNRGPRSIEGAINDVINKWLPKYLKQAVANNKSTQEFKKEAKARLVEFLSDEDNWSRVDIARQRYGKPRKGILEKIGEGVKNFDTSIQQAPETRQKPRTGLF